MLDDQSYGLYGLSRIAYENDDLEAAEQQATQAIQLAKQRHSEQLQVQAALILCQVQHARGQTAHARSELQSLAAQTRNPSLLREIQSWQARLALWHRGTQRARGACAAGARGADRRPFVPGARPAAGRAGAAGTLASRGRRARAHPQRDRDSSVAG